MEKALRYISTHLWNLANKVEHFTFWLVAKWNNFLKKLML
jgi:hypothetical protein